MENPYAQQGTGKCSTCQPLVSAWDEGFAVGRQEGEKKAREEMTFGMQALAKEARQVGKQEGIREVCEWIEEHQAVPYELDVVVLRHEWQSQKKKWGINLLAASIVESPQGG